MNRANIRADAACDQLEAAIRDGGGFITMEEMPDGFPWVAVMARNGSLERLPESIRPQAEALIEQWRLENGVTPRSEDPGND